MTVLVTKRNAVVESVIVYQSTHTVYPKYIVMSKDFYISIKYDRHAEMMYNFFIQKSPFVFSNHERG